MKKDLVIQKEDLSLVFNQTKMTQQLINDLEQSIRNLKSKRDNFIGNLRDKETMAESEGFRCGLDWAIESIETVLNNFEIANA